MMMRAGATISALWNIAAEKAGQTERAMGHWGVATLLLLLLIAAFLASGIWRSGTS